ncbi:MAG TPA: hypothetical protein VMU95_10335 [Trebonia sp.]|nr:hypothetical protein [Trebonia sp.]
MERESRQPEEAWHSVNITNDGDGVRVGTQIGYVQDAHFYDVPKSATPADRFEKAVNLLGGNMPRKAEALIRQAVEDQYKSNRVAYYWALSVVSGRPFDIMRQKDFETLLDCVAMADRTEADEWVPALDVVTRFIDCLLYQDQYGILNDDQLEQVTRELESLADDRQEEIRRHLDLIMTGALQDQWEDRHAKEISDKRKADHRAERVWKYFAPNPCPPVRIQWPEPRLGLLSRVEAAAGAVLLGAGLLAMLVVTVTSRPLLTLAVIIGAGGGGYLLATSGKGWLIRREQIAADARRHGESPERGRYSPPAPREEKKLQGHREENPTREEEGRYKREDRHLKIFRELAGPWVDYRFAERNPDRRKDRERWWEDTAGPRAALTDRIRRQYAHPDRTLSEVDWLITWHAKRARSRWDDDALRARRSELQAWHPGLVLLPLGAIAVIAGLVVGVVGTFLAGRAAVGVGALVLVVVALGTAAVLASEIDVYVVQRGLREAESALNQAEHDEETRAFEERVKRLEGRPTDAEMARWLDYDKLYIKKLVMNDCNLVNRDIITHTILTEGKFPCRRARVLYGPPRYSRYRVIVLLLTNGGVEQSTAELDFYDGTVTGLYTQSYNYDKIDWADVGEAGIRLDSGRRSVVLLDEHRRGESGADGAGGQENEDGEPGQANGRSAGKDGNGKLGRLKDLKDVDSLILAKAFQLVIAGYGKLDVVVENFDHGFLDRLQEDKEAMLELALDNSGVTGAVLVLKTIAREGRDRLEWMKQRRTRQVTDFTKSLNKRKELPWHSRYDALPAAADHRLVRGEIEG